MHIFKKPLRNHSLMRTLEAIPFLTVFFRYYLKRAKHKSFANNRFQILHQSPCKMLLTSASLAWQIYLQNRLFALSAKSVTPTKIRQKLRVNAPELECWLFRTYLQGLNCILEYYCVKAWYWKALMCILDSIIIYVTRRKLFNLSSVLLNLHSQTKHQYQFVAVFEKYYRHSNFTIIILPLDCMRRGF